MDHSDADKADERYFRDRVVTSSLGTDPFERSLVYMFSSIVFFFFFCFFIVTYEYRRDSVTASRLHPPPPLFARLHSANTARLRLRRRNAELRNRARMYDDDGREGRPAPTAEAGSGDPARKSSRVGKPDLTRCLLELAPFVSPGRGAFVGAGMRGVSRLRDL